MDTLFSLKEKNILITGASSGIGKQCALTFSQLGANLILVARNEERLKNTFQAMEKGNHLFFSQDITEYEKLEEIVSKSVEKIGKISGFVHSAGIEETLPFRSMEASNYEKLFSVNVVAGFELARIISKKKYLANNGSSFVFISSIFSVISKPAIIAYSSSKGALISGIKSMALELAKKNIRVNCISPGHIEDTKIGQKILKILIKEELENNIKLYPLGLGKTTDIANACLFLLSNAARWITGINLIVDGGYTIK